MSNEQNRIALNIIVKNEEKFLRGCLESIKNLVDEIVLADTGSTDSTVAIAS
jgi:glycosyltransferase involved in cell wall biosynthesis